MAKLVVEAIGVSRSFVRGGHPTEALLPASFTVAAGDRVALTGPSGSGKSTLLHLMAGLDEPSGGRLAWPALGDRASLRPSRVGMVFQAPSLLPSLSVVENVELPMRLGRCPEDVRARATAALEAVGLVGMGDALPDELSGGQAQRVGIARALAHRPALILADEPTGQLDHATARLVLDVLLAALQGTGTTLVVATHDPLVAGRLDRVWTMSHGRLDTLASAAAVVAPRREGAHA